MDVIAEVTRLFGLTSRSQVEAGDEIIGAGGFLSLRQAVTVRTDSGDTVKAFLKFIDASRSDLQERQLISQHFCRNECVFYGVMAPILESALQRCRLLPTFPHSFGQKFSKDGSILVMQDLTQLGYHSASSLLTLAEARSVVCALAKVQAAYWLARTDLDFALDDSMFGQGSQFSNQFQKGALQKNLNMDELMQMNLTYFFDNFASYANPDQPDDVAVIRDEMLHLRSDVEDMFVGRTCNDSSLPLGIAQGDLWKSNVMFKEAGGHVDCQIFDWQFWEIAPFGYDLGVTFLSSLPHEIVIAEMENLFKLLYTEFKRIFEANSERSVPFSEQEAMRCLGASLFHAVVWVLITMRTIVASDIVPFHNMLSNLAFVLKRKLLQVPTRS